MRSFKSMMIRGTDPMPSGAMHFPLLLAGVLAICLSLTIVGYASPQASDPQVVALDPQVLATP